MSRGGCAQPGWSPAEDVPLPFCVFLHELGWNQPDITDCPCLPGFCCSPPPTGPVDGERRSDCPACTSQILNSLRLWTRHVCALRSQSADTKKVTASSQGRQAIECKKAPGRSTVSCHGTWALNNGGSRAEGNIHCAVRLRTSCCLGHHQVPCTLATLKDQERQARASEAGQCPVKVRRTQCCYCTMCCAHMLLLSCWYRSFAA